MTTDFKFPEDMKEHETIADYRKRKNSDIKARTDVLHALEKIEPLDALAMVMREKGLDIEFFQRYGAFEIYVRDENGRFNTIKTIYQSTITADDIKPEGD